MREVGMGLGMGMGIVIGIGMGLGIRQRNHLQTQYSNENDKVELVVVGDGLDIRSSQYFKYLIGAFYGLPELAPE
jgi:hypothetical protein